MARAALVNINANAVDIRIVRRSTASPTEPPTSEPMISGASPARLTAPTWNEECVSW